MHIESKNVTGEGFRGSKPSENINEINFIDCPVTDAGLEAIAKMAPKLKCLILTSEKITDASIPAIAKLTHLKTLCFVDADLTDKSLKLLAKLPRLEEINIRGAKVTDDGLVTFLVSSNLKELTFNKKQFKLETIEKIKKASPHLKLNEY